MPLSDSEKIARLTELFQPDHPTTLHMPHPVSTDSKVMSEWIAYTAARTARVREILGVEDFATSPDALPTEED